MRAACRCGLAPESHEETRGPRPWGRPWRPPGCAPRGHSGATRGQCDLRGCGILACGKFLKPVHNGPVSRQVLWREAIESGTKIRLRGRRKAVPERSPRGIVEPTDARRELER